MLDPRLPDVSDLSLLAAIRRLLPGAGVFVITAVATPEIVAAALQLGAREVLDKPFELDDLTECVLGCERPS